MTPSTALIRSAAQKGFANYAFAPIVFANSRNSRFLPAPPPDTVMMGMPGAICSDSVTTSMPSLFGMKMSVTTIAGR